MVNCITARTLCVRVPEKTFASLKRECRFTLLLRAASLGQEDESVGDT